MKKLFIILIIFCLGIGFATKSRINALGGGLKAITVIDERNIATFPTELKNYAGIFVQDVNTSNPEYLVTFREPNQRWGIYGGSDFDCDIIRGVKMLGENRAVNVGLRLHRMSHNADNEISGNPDEGSNTTFDFLLDGTYGIQSGDTRYAFYGGFERGPGDISFFNSPWMVNYDDWNPQGSLEWNDFEGSAGNSTIFGGARILQPRQIDVLGIPFSQFYGEAGLFFGFGHTEYTWDDTSAAPPVDHEDTNYFTFGFGGIGGISHEQQVADNTTLFYDLSFDFFFKREAAENKVAENEEITTRLAMMFPNCSVGLETETKWGDFRFGFEKGMYLFDYDGSSFEDTDSSATSQFDFDEQSTTQIGDKGYYSFRTGWGFQWGDFGLDIVLNRKIWESGPQLLFNTNNGNELASTADIYYNFPIRKPKF